MNFIQANLGYIKLGIIAIGVFLIYSFGTHHQKTKDDLQNAQERIKLEKAISKAQADNESLKTLLNKRKESNVKKNNDLHNSHPASGLFIKSCTSETNSTTGSESTITTNGILSDKTKAANRRLQQGLEQLTVDSDNLTEQCRVIQGYAQSLSERQN